MDQERQRRAQENDGAEDQKLLPFADDDGAQKLPAHLKFQRQGKAFRQRQLDVRVALKQIDHGTENGTEQHRDADALDQENGVLDNAFKNAQKANELNPEDYQPYYIIYLPKLDKKKNYLVERHILIFLIHGQKFMKKMNELYHDK